MVFLPVLAKVLLGILLAAPSNTFAWDEEQGGNEYLLDQSPLDFAQQSQQGDVIMRVRARKPDGGESEVSALDWYKSPVILPSSYATSLYAGRKLYANPVDWVNERLEVVPGIKKRYMGMEIPEFVTKGDGTVGAPMVSGGDGGPPPRGGMKHKLVHSG